MGKITKYLNQLIVGGVFDSHDKIDFYATDNSALKITPKYVILPESTEDVRKVIRFVNQVAAKNIPVSVTARGAGTGLTGGCLSGSIAVSTERLNRLLEIDAKDKLVRVQSGITLKELNTALSVSGLTIPISGQDKATIGGLISEYSTDYSSAKYGGIANYIKRIEVVLTNGECLQTERLRRYTVAKKAAEKSLEGDIYRKISKVLHDNTPLIAKMNAKDKTCRFGYPGITSIYERDTLDLMPLFLGAQGTLGIITEVILKAESIKKPPLHIVATFKDLKVACKFMDSLEPLRPSTLNFCDLKIVNVVQQMGKNLDGVIKKANDGFAVFATLDEYNSFAIKRVNAIKQSLPRGVKMVIEPAKADIINDFSHILSIYLNYTKDGERVPALTDFYLPNDKMEDFLSDLKILQEKLDLDLAIFGSYANSIYSLRPEFKLNDAEYPKKFATFLKAGEYVITKHGGALAGGSAEGRIKTFGTANITEEEKNLYQEIKKIFNPNNILNPGVKFNVKPKYIFSHLRNDTPGKPIL